MSIDGRSAIVTGGASGIGLATVRRFAELGVRVLAVDVNRDALNNAFADAANVTLLEADLRQFDAPETIVSSALVSFGSVDILVNCAAHRDYFATVIHTEPAVWDTVLTVNVTAPFLLSRAVLPGMLERGRGVIVNIASIAAFQGGKGGAAYTVSKHGILGLTRAIAVEYGDAGIRSVAVAPGGVATPGRSSQRAAETEGRAATELQPATGVISPGAAATSGPWGRGLDPDGRAVLERTRGAKLSDGRPEDIAAIVAFLVSDDATLINGACLTADAAWTVH